MHILMVAPQPFFRPRGTPLSVLHRIRGLTRLGHTVDLVTYPFGESPEVPGLTIHRATRPPLVRGVGVGPSVAKLLLDGPLLRTAMRLAGSGRYDLLHTHEEAGWIGGLFRRKYGLPHLYDMHSSLPQQVGNFRQFAWPPVIAAFDRLERRTFRGADGIIAICPALYEHVLASGYGGPVALIENTLDFDLPAASAEATRGLRERLGLGDGPVLVYTGTLEPYQGMDLLIAALPAVLGEEPRLRLVVVGGTEPQIAGLARDAAGRGVAAAVTFVPAVPPADVPLYHQLADVLVTTRSKGTNTPLKLYQYLRAGRPMVATDIASHTQVLDPAVAELVPPEPTGIAAGIIRVLRDPAHGRALAAAAASLAAERYSGSIYMQRLEDLVARVAAPARQPSVREQRSPVPCA